MSGGKSKKRKGTKARPLPDLIRRQRAIDLMMKRFAGRNFKLGTQEAVVGSYAAQQLGWKIGSTFHPHHGLSEEAVS